MKMLLGLFPALLSAACLSVTGDRIVASDLYPAIPSFVSIAPTTVVGYSPEPGVVRNLSRGELLSFAHSHGLALEDAPEVCVIIPMAGILQPAALSAAMRRVLPAGAELEILETTQAAVPTGTITFTLDGIEPPQPADPSAQLWKGYVTYAGSRKFRIWARVRVSVIRPELVALRALRQGDTLTADAVSVEPRRGSLRPDVAVRTLEEAIGLKLLKSIREGEKISAAQLSPPVKVHRGDPVKVEVINGPAHLLLSAIAEGNAREGDIVQLRNPSTGKTFSARLEPGGKAVIALSKIP